MDDKVSIDRSSIVRALEQIEIIVPSLDRLGSSASEMSEGEFNRAVADFIRDWDVFSRLTEVRRVLWACFSYDEREQLFGDLPTWSLNKRRPQANDK